MHWSRARWFLSLVLGIFSIGRVEFNRKFTWTSHTISPYIQFWVLRRIRAGSDCGKPGFACFAGDTARGGRPNWIDHVTKPSSWWWCFIFEKMAVVSCFFVNFHQCVIQKTPTFQISDHQSSGTEIPVYPYFRHFTFSVLSMCLDIKTLGFRPKNNILRLSIPTKYGFQINSFHFRAKKHGLISTQVNIIN